MDLPDRTLLERFIAQRDEAAFRLLVERYLGLVHAVAKRVTADDELARDVAQNTFIRLAQRANLIPLDVTVAAWTHRTARSLAVDLVRVENRRKKRELDTIPSDADAMHLTDPEPDWSGLAPVVDQLVDSLPATARDVLLLRYYQNASHASIAQKLGLTEEVARKRAFRAIEKLRALLGKRGIATSAAALAALLPAHGASPAPAGLMLSVLHASKAATPLISNGLLAGIFAVTTTQKTAIASAALLFAATVAYTAYASGPDARAGALESILNPAETDDSAGKPNAARTRNERSLPGSPEDRLEHLHAILAIASPTERSRELIAFLDRLPPAEFAQAVEDIGRNGSVYRAELDLALSAWAKMDVMAALAFTRCRPYGSGKPVLETWASLDPAAALAWARNGAPAADRQEDLTFVLSGIARQNPGAALKAVESLADAEERSLLLRQIYNSMSDQPDAFNRLIGVATDPHSRRDLVEMRALGSVETRDPASAAETIQAYPDAVSGPVACLVYQSWATQEPEQAIDSLATLPPGKIREQAVAGVGSSLAAKDPAGAFQLLKDYPGDGSDYALRHVINATMASDPGYAIGRIPQIADEQVRNDAYLTNLQSWMERAPDAARQWLDANPVPDSVRQKLNGN